MVHWLESLGYLGVFLGPLIGSFTFYFVPWPLAIIALGQVLDPVLVSIVGATGATVGTAAYYLVGEGMNRVLPKKMREQVGLGRRYIERYGALAIFFFALTPFPDQIVWIPVGLMKYDPKKALVACWLGKLVLIAVMVYASRFGIQEILRWFS